LRTSENRSDPNELYREYYLGITINTENASFDNLEKAATECGQLGEQNLVVIDEPWYNLPERVASVPIGTGLINIAVRSWGGMTPVLQTNFWNLTESYDLNLVISPSMPADTLINDTIFIEEWVDHCVNLTTEQAQDFFILSKEVNDYWSPSFPNPGDSVNNTYQDFLQLMRNSTEEIHKVAPNTKTIIEFRMPSLNANDQWDLVAQVNSSHCDVIGFTSYPYLLNDSSEYLGTLYPTPQDLPDDYYAKILDYTDMPIAFTEIGWSTSDLYNDTKKYDFTGTNETEQEDFIDVFFEQINELPQVELVNWLYLHDTENKTEETNPNQLIGIKHLNGTKKLAYDNWQRVTNRTYLEKSEVVFNVNSINTAMTSDYSNVNVTVNMDKSHAAMFWIVNASSNDNTNTYSLSGPTKSNSTSFLINETILPKGSYNLEIIGNFEDVYTNWTVVLPVVTEPSSLLLTSNASFSEPDITFTLNWTKSIYANNYSVFWSTHSIADSNINATNDVYLLYNGTALEFDVVDWRFGMFYFKVFAINEYGNSSSEIEINFKPTYFVDDINGDDSNDGRSPENAWRSIDKVNSFSFKPGDTALFRRGGMWRGSLDPQSGNSTNRVTYGAYGTGDKPKILGSWNKSSTSDWFDEGGNIWSTNRSKEIGAEILPNPSFGVDRSDWLFYNATGTQAEWYRDTFCYDSGPASLGINCTKIGDFADNISLIAENIDIVAGCFYNFSFRAKCTQEFNVSGINIIKSADDYGKLFSHASNQTPTIKTVWTTYHVLFKASETNNSGWIVFSLGDCLPEGSTFNIDTLSFKKLQNDTLFYTDVGNLILNNEEQCGWKMWYESDLDTQGEFWYDEENWIIKMYSTQNPGSYYSSIETCNRMHIIDEEGQHNIIYENLHLMYGGAHGIGGGNTCNITVKDCDFSYIGGSELPGNIYNNIRFGNAVEFWANASNNIVEGCNIWEIYDAGITNQGIEENNVQNNLIYRNNTIWNCEYSFEIWNQPASAQMHNVYMENNTCYNAGFGWGAPQRYDPHGYHVLLGYTTANTSDVFIRNNTFYETTISCIYVATPNWYTNATIDYNRYYSTALVFINDSIYYGTSQFAEYQAGTGFDEHSIVLNKQPEFNNVMATPSTIYVGTEITVTVEVTSIFNTESVWIEILGKNHTMSLYLGEYNFTWTFNSTGTFLCTIYANDTIGNFNQISGTITVNPNTLPGGSGGGGGGGGGGDGSDQNIPGFSLILIFFVSFTVIIVIIKLDFPYLKKNHIKSK
ncbi:MAG: hypothetical protein ACFFAO_00200, partial [Candidatus Hermodarchaeota archaeon]